MKFKIQLISLLFIGIFFSCGKDKTSQDNNGGNANVYVTGTYGDTAVYWKNNQKFILGANARAEAIAIFDSDVFISGYSTASGRTGYWKNGVWINLPNPGGVGPFGPSSIYISGSDVYVAEGNHYWKNGVLIFPSSFGSNSTATGIKVVGKDVYISGKTISSRSSGDTLFTLDTAFYWKNGKQTILSTNGMANSILVSGTDIYVSGSDNGDAVYWKNSKKVVLAHNGSASQIIVSNGNVYVLGILGSSIQELQLVYWKNGRMITLSGPSGTPPPVLSYVNGMAVGGDKVYISGWIRPAPIGTHYFPIKAIYWQNNIQVNLPDDPYLDTEAFGIAIGN